MSALDQQTFLKEYTRALRDGNAAILVGAGVSRAAGYVDWKGLLRDIAEELGLDVDRESDLVALAQYHFNHRQGRDRLNQKLVDEFMESVELTEAHKLIACLPLHTVWTTNYDDLLETAFKDAGKRIDVKRRKEDFGTNVRRADATIYKMHGDKTLPADAVLMKEDYETYNVSRELFTIAFKGDLTSKTFLFLGFSFNDPNVLYLLARVKQLLDVNSRKHYCLLRRPRPEDCDDGDYQCKRFYHWLTDLRRYNIQPVLIDDYDEIPALLLELNRRSHLRDVFISGSAHDFSPLGNERFHELCRLLGNKLIKQGFNVISGYGLGVGDKVIVGALQELPRNDDERLQLWPFPQSVPSGTDRAALWKEYRERMISGAGICVVLAGNKLESDKVIPANGVHQEVDIARSHNKVVIPVGATGHVAREIWQEMHPNLAEHYGHADVAESFRILGDESASSDSLVAAVIDILTKLDK